MANPQNIFSPKSFDDFVISDPTSATILQSIFGGGLPFPHMKRATCLWGTYGTGKTTLAEMLPRLLEESGKLQKSVRPASLFDGYFYWHLTACGFGAHSVLMMQDMKKRMDSDVSHSPSGWHYEILDEVDMLTPAAQGSLKSLTTQASSTIFIFTTNHLTKLDRGLVDRSLLIEMNQPKPDQMAEMGRRFLRQMGLTGDEVQETALHGMAAASRGSLRDFGGAVMIEGLKHGGVINI